MAIRIIDTQPHKSVVKEIVCRNCGVTLEYTPNDVKDYISHDYGGGSDTYYYIPCPSCNHKVSIKY